MARYCTTQSQNWTASTWNLVDATMFLDSEAASTTTTTSYVASSGYTPGAITVSGILLNVKGTLGGAGTFSVELYNSTDAASVGSVTCNVSDIVNADSTNDGGWIQFDFGTTYLLVAGKSYVFRIKSSTNATVTVYRDATANNWSGALVTTATGTLAAADDVFICGKITAAATRTVYTVTHDLTATTSYGKIRVGQDGKWVSQNSASTNYKITISDTSKIYIAHNGIVEWSSSSSRLPSTSSFVVQFTCASAGSNGIEIRNYGTLRAYGDNGRTRRAKLAADAAASATSLTSSVSGAGWKNGDNIVIASTTQSNTQTERKALTADQSGTSLTITALTNAHGGNSSTGVQADIYNVTSNFQFLGTSTTSTFYINSAQRATFDLDNIEFRYIGSGTANKRGINSSCRVTYATNNLKSCGFHDTNISAYCFYATSHDGGITIDDCLAWGGSIGFAFDTNSAFGAVGSGTGSTITNCVALQQGNIGLYLNADPNSSINNSVGSCSGNAGISFSGNTSVSSFTGLTAYGNGANVGFSTSFKSANATTTISNLTLWRNAFGFSINGTTGLSGFIFDNINCFGNTSYGGAISGINNTVIKNSTFNAGLTTLQTIGIQFQNTGGYHMYNCILDNCSFGATQTHSTGDIQVKSTIIGEFSIIARDCTFSSSTTLSNQTSMGFNSSLAMQKISSTVGNNKVFKKYGTLTTDSTLYDTSPYSQRLTPNNASNKLIGSDFSINVPNSSVATVTVKVRKSKTSTGDSATYNGNQPRLILRANPALGSTYDSDIVAATATSASDGAWETLSYTLPSSVSDNGAAKFYIDCDGTAGWVNWDTVTVT